MSKVSRRPGWSSLLPLCVGLVVLVVPAAQAHDLHAEGCWNTTAPGPSNPRSGSGCAKLQGTFEFNEIIDAWAGFTWTHDLPTKTAETRSAGSDIFLISAGADLTFNSHWSAALAANYSPSAQQRSATTITYADVAGRTQSADVVLHSFDDSAGFLATGTWDSAGSSVWESSVDLTGGATHFGVVQKYEVPATAKGDLLRASCAADSVTKRCGLLRGQSTPLWQGRLAAAYTATLLTDLDLGLEVAWYLYDTDPSSVGYFTVAALGRGTELGAGVPAAPFLFTLKPTVSYRFERVSLSAWYRVGPYVDGQGTNHLVAVRASIKLARHWRLLVTLSGQEDVLATGPQNLGGTVLVGVTWRS